MLKDFDLVCVTEGELLQWKARGLMHLAAGRVIPSGYNKSSLFALAPLIKLDDAKARVVVNLASGWSDEDITHPIYGLSNLISIPWDQIKSIAPVMPQFRRRLENFGLYVEEWDISELWSEWLFTQGCYERLKMLQITLRKIGFNSNDFLSDTSLIGEIVKMVVRPNAKESVSSILPIGWKTLLRNRDEILKKLRFDGHADRLSFLESSILEIIKINGYESTGFKLHEEYPEKDFGWEFQDLTTQILEVINRFGGDCPLSMDNKVSLVFGAIYLRLYDELFYGQKNWKLCFNLLRFAKYSLDSQQADLLTIAILASYSADELLALDLPTTF